MDIRSVKSNDVNWVPFIIMISDFGSKGFSTEKAGGEHQYFNGDETAFSLKEHPHWHWLLENWDLYFLFSINMEMNTGVPVS